VGPTQEDRHAVGGGDYLELDDRPFVLAGVEQRLGPLAIGRNVDANGERIDSTNDVPAKEGIGRVVCRATICPGMREHMRERARQQFGARPNRGRKVAQTAQPVTPWCSERAMHALQSWVLFEEPQKFKQVPPNSITTNRAQSLCPQCQQRQKRTSMSNRTCTSKYR